MDEDYYTARVPRDVADLVPVFLRNRHKEVADMRALLDAGDFAKLADLAQRMSGVGTPYGFPYISNAARVLYETAQRRDAGTLRELLDEMSQYLRLVKIVVQ